MGDYLHLHLQNAKVNIANKFNQLNIVESKIGSTMRNRSNRIWNTLPEYMQKRDKNFENWVATAVNNTSYGNGERGAAQISPGVSELGLASFQVGKLKEDAVKLKKAVNELNQALLLIDTVDRELNQDIAVLAMENPNIRRMLGISFPDGLYQISTDTNRINEQIKNSLETAKKHANNASQIAGGAQSDDALGAILKGIESIISSNRGFLYEVEVLKGFLLSIKEGNTNLAVAYTGRLGQEKKDPKIKQDIEKANAIEAQLSQILSSIQTSEPKADLMCSIGESGAVSIFGVSIKSVSNRKSEGILKGLKRKDLTVGLGSSYKTLDEVFARYKSVLSSAIGGYDPAWYGAQILTGWTDNRNITQHLQSPETGGGIYTAAWNQLLNLSAALVLIDALVGDAQQIETGGVATYLVVNGQIYWAKDILNKAALALEKGIDPGIYGETSTTLNRAWGQQVQNNALIAWSEKASIEQMKQDRSQRIWQEWDDALSKQIIKVKISLGALTKLAGSQGLRPIN